MKVVVADATPLHYLILIREIDLLPRIFDQQQVCVNGVRQRDFRSTNELGRSWRRNGD